MAQIRITCNIFSFKSLYPNSTINKISMSNFSSLNTHLRKNCAKFTFTVQILQIKDFLNIFIKILYASMQKDFSDDPYRPENNKILQENEDEKNHYIEVLTSFLNYRLDSIVEVARLEQNYQSIYNQLHLLKYPWESRVSNLRESIEINGQFLDILTQAYTDQVKLVDIGGGRLFPKNKSEHRNISKIQSTLKQFVREWAQEGKEERDQCYKVIIDEFLKYFPSPQIKEKDRIRVLVPGCGLGRLAFEFASLGYISQGNEFSYFMLISSNYILNMVDEKQQFEIVPYIHSFSNNINEFDAFQKIQIPDINPADHVNEDSDFSMVGGEFISVYQDQIEQWHSVVTCFFIDTANNIIDYIYTIYSILQNGGVWINFGPLLYHYAEQIDEISIELSWEEVKHIIINTGFQIVQEEMRQTTYSTSQNNMMQTVYNCIFFTAIQVQQTIEHK